MAKQVHTPNSSRSSGSSVFEHFSDNDLFIDKSERRKPSEGAHAMTSVEVSLPPVKPLAESGHSLEPDMLFGWRPKILELQGPIPLNFSLDPLPHRKPIFLGFRPEDSFELHEAFAGPYPFAISPALKHSYEVVRSRKPKTDPRPYLGMDPSSQEPLEFSSFFESGNLDMVVKVKNLEYDLYIRTDSNTRGRYQWFYFSVRNLSIPQTYKFNILNFSKRDSLYTQGLQLCVHRDAKGWHRAGENIHYKYSKLNKDTIRKGFYSLTFTYFFPANEKVYFSQCVPYTYSALVEFTKSLEEHPLVEVGSLCKSLSGLDVPLLSITDRSSQGKKETIFVTGRVHPGETHSSVVVEGLIRYLLEPDALSLLRRCVFKIIPMLNPDGVVVGNSRCNLSGDDLNRRFQNPDSTLHPTVFSIKELLKTLTKSKFLSYIDVHSHFRKKGSFMYGPYYPLHSRKYYEIRILPKLMSEATDAFRYHSSKFRYDRSKRSTARLLIWKEFKFAFSYTLETSCHGYLDSERITQDFNVQSLHNLGAALAATHYEYLELRDEEAKIKEAKKQERLNKKRKLSPTKALSKSPSFERSPIKLRNHRTLADVIQSIKAGKEQEKCEEEESSSSSSEESDEEDNEEQILERQMIKKNIIDLLDQMNIFAKNPPRIQSIPPKSPPKIGNRPVKKDSFRCVPRNVNFKEKIPSQLHIRAETSQRKLPTRKMPGRKVMVKAPRPVTSERIRLSQMAAQIAVQMRNHQFNQEIRNHSEQRFVSHKNSDSERSLLTKLREIRCRSAHKKKLNLSVNGKKVVPFDIEKNLSGSLDIN